nr:high-affinity branched-chain amino acid ABC transporter permease LivM [Phreatobacter stygius]
MAPSQPVAAAVASPARDFAGAIKDGLFAGLIALGVFGPLIGFKTVVDMQNRLILETRWGLLASIVLTVAAGRFLISAYQRRRADTPTAKPAFVWPAAVSKGLPPAALLVLFVYPMMIYGVTGGSGALKWIDNFGVQILIYIMLAWGLNVVVGLAGLLDLGYVAFYAVGAYAYALLATQVIPATFPQLGVWAFWICLPIAGMLAAFWGVLLGFPVLRLRGDYLAIVTLAFGEIIRMVLVNWKDFSNGYEGISTIPRPSFFGIPFNASDTGFAAVFGLEFSPVYRTIFLYYVILCLALLTAWVSTRLRRLPVGRAWEALREDEIACRSLGINTVNTKLTAFAIGAMFGGFAGSFFAARQGFISPESFTFLESATILAIVVLGGMGSLIGTAIAAVAMIGGTELLRELDWMKLIFGNDFDPAQYRMLIFGLAMVAIMIWKPRGFVSTRMPTAFLKSRRKISSDLVKEGHG